MIYKKFLFIISSMVLISAHIYAKCCKPTNCRPACNLNVTTNSNTSCSTRVPICAAQINVPGGLTISVPGEYYLCGDVTVNALATGNAAINITVSDVFIEGNNVTIQEQTAPETIGILIAPGVSNVKIQNLNIKGFGLLGIYAPQFGNNLVLNNLLVEENGRNTAQGIPLPFTGLVLANTAGGVPNPNVPAFFAGGIAIIGSVAPAALTNDIVPLTEIVIQNSRFVRNRGASDIPHADDIYVNNTVGGGALIMHAADVAIDFSHFDGNGSIAIDTGNLNPTTLSPTVGGGLLAWHVRDVAVFNSTFDNNVGNERGVGLYFHANINTTLTDVVVPLNRSSNINISHSSMSHNRSLHSECTGLTLGYVDDALIDLCNVNRNLSFGLAGITANRIYARDSQFNGSYQGDLGNGGVVLLNCIDCTFVRCQMSDNFANDPNTFETNGVFLFNCLNTILDGCWIERNGVTGAAPFIPFNDISSGVVITDCRNTTIENCTINNNIGEGINVLSVPFGPSITGSIGNIIKHNEISYNSGPGIKDDAGLVGFPPVPPFPPLPETSPANTVNVYFDNYALNNFQTGINYVGLPAGTPIDVWVLGTPPVPATVYKLDNLSIIQT